MATSITITPDPPPINNTPPRTFRMIGETNLYKYIPQPKGITPPTPVLLPADMIFTIYSDYSSGSGGGIFWFFNVTTGLTETYESSQDTGNLAANDIPWNSGADLIINIDPQYGLKEVYKIPLVDYIFNGYDINTTTLTIPIHPNDLLQLIYSD